MSNELALNRLIAKAELCAARDEALPMDVYTSLLESGIDPSQYSFSNYNQTCNTTNEE